MSITLGDKKQELNFTYLQTVAAIAGFTFNLDRQDYGVDGSFRKIGQLPNGSYYPETRALNFQAKATVNASRLRDGIHISYNMDVEHHNKLAYMNNDNSSPCLLIVMALPNDENKWVKFSEDIMQMSGCCYWEIIRKETTNESKTSVRLFRKNQFNPSALAKLYEDMKNGSL